MVSVPLAVEDYRKTTLFSTATSNAFAYEGGYIQKDTLAMGPGYWLKFTGNQSIRMEGYEILKDTFDVVQGWNMIGSISEPAPTAGITSIPPEMVTSSFYGFENGYKLLDTIPPGTGVWVKCESAGQIVMDVTLDKNSPARIVIIPIADLPPPPPEDPAIHNQQSEIPSQFGLDQNYPNPFNPLTIIKYQLPIDSWVTLKIYNMLGEEVATLINSNQSAGYKSVEFNATRLSSGLYIYTLRAGSFTDVKKMVLLK
jgi:hypothetical protein